MKVKLNEKGLVPAIAQDINTGQHRGIIEENLQHEGDSQGGERIQKHMEGMVHASLTFPVKIKPVHEIRIPDDRIPLRKALGVNHTNWEVQRPQIRMDIHLTHKQRGAQEREQHAGCHEGNNC